MATLSFVVEVEVDCKGSRGGGCVDRKHGAVVTVVVGRTVEGGGWSGSGGLF